MDVAAGTGIVGEILNGMGFKNIDACGKLKSYLILKTRQESMVGFVQVVVSYLEISNMQVLCLQDFKSATKN